MGQHSFRKFVKDIDKVKLGSGATLEIRDTEPAARMDITAVTWLNDGAKGIQPTLTTPRTDRDISAISKPTSEGIGWYKWG